MGIPKIEKGKDFHKFGRVTVDGYAFADESDFTFNFRAGQMTFSLVNEGTSGCVEYSFNGNTVHGDLTVDTPTEAIFFDNRVVPGIWFRIRSGPSSTIRVEGWAVR